MKQLEPCIVSACLVGLCTRYDAQIKASVTCIEQLRGTRWIPICPEQLGGLPTPRTAADIVGGDGNDVLAGKAKVITRTGEDVTSQFLKGGQQCLQIAQSQQITTALLKSGSPSCGLSRKIGVTAALLRQHGIRIIEF